LGGSRSFKVIDVGTTGKLVGSACYDKQQACVYLQPLSSYIQYRLVDSSRNRTFSRGYPNLMRSYWLVLLTRTWPSRPRT